MIDSFLSPVGGNCGIVDSPARTQEGRKERDHPVDRPLKASVKNIARLGLAVDLRWHSHEVCARGHVDS